MPTTASAEDLTQQARFVFVGSVVRLKAATMAQVPVTDRTAIVRVDRIVLAPAALSEWAGKEITVQLSGTGGVQEGQQYEFFTNGWLFGESIAVQALDQRPVTPELTAQSGDPAHALAERDLQAHSASADLIVTGKVLSIRLPTAGVAVAGGPVPRKPIKEHDPEWREAVIGVESVVKGNHPEQQLVVQYPASTDIAWYKAPKLQPGDEGVFLLHEVGGLQRETAAAHAILDVMDFQPSSKLDQIRASIKASTHS